MSKKYLTIEDLFLFCQQNNLTKFSASTADGPVIVQSFGKMSSFSDSATGLTPCTLQACHTELNANNSFIEESVAEKALSSFANRPILAYMHELDDGTWDFWDHRMTVEEDADGEPMLIYLEQPIGIIPESCNARLEYDEDKEKTYVVVDGLIYNDYSNRALDIIEQYNGEVVVSVEIALNEFSFNAKDNYLNIEDFTFMGVTLLGKSPDGVKINPGMQGSNLKLNDFSVKENSIFSECNQDKLIEVLDKLNTTLTSFSNVDSCKKGGDAEVDKFNELLEKYELTAEEITFEYEGMSDEELENAFKEFVESKEGFEEELDDEGEDVIEDEDAEDDTDGDDDSVIDTAACKKRKKCSLDEEGNMTVAFELSHDDIRGALYNLLAPYDEQDDEWYYISAVYDSYFVYENWSGDKIFKQPYGVDGDNVSFEGERQQVFKIIVSESEKIAIEEMRSNYSALEEKYNELKEFKDKYDADMAQAEKDAIFSCAEYDGVRESDEFKKLIEDAANYTADEIRVKADLIFAASMKKQFAIETNEKRSKVSININEHPGKKSAYAGLFD